jgi:arylsulfatase A-like enzyme
MMSQQKKPNVVLFGIDSLLSEHMSCYGYERLTTPHIDRFATGGTLLKTPLARTSRRPAPILRC